MKAIVFKRDRPMIVTPLFSYDEYHHYLLSSGYVLSNDLCKNVLSKLEPKYDILIIKEKGKEKLLLKKDFTNSNILIYENIIQGRIKYVYKLDSNNCIELFTNDLIRKGE